MEERRSARVGTVSGLALLAGGTAMAAASGGGTHSVFATFLLVLLTAGLGHALAVEISRQARRGSPPRWRRADTANAVLLGTWAELSLILAIVMPGPERFVGLGLAAAYTAGCVYFVTERRRAAATAPSGRASRTTPAETHTVPDDALASPAENPVPTSLAETPVLVAPAETPVLVAPAKTPTIPGGVPARPAQTPTVAAPPAETPTLPRGVPVLPAENEAVAGRTPAAPAGAHAPAYGHATPAESRAGMPEDRTMAAETLAVPAKTLAVPAKTRLVSAEAHRAPAEERSVLVEPGGETKRHPAAARLETAASNHVAAASAPTEARR
ncbi:hypothetical protein, partial [Paractinoplanes deccanensis]|uniref:hypothetical protein n=1 Tax=Paractinoplanes deccanensis TaxID=113561 RepID=UPI001942A49C